MPGLDPDDVRAAMTGRWADFYAQFTTLKPLGGELRGPCPIHRGTGLNLAVNPDTGLYRCFSGCGDGGNAFQFIERLEGVTFPEALARVAAYAGVSEDAAPRVVKYRPLVGRAVTPPAAPLDPCLAEELHQRLMNCDPMRTWLSEERGLMTETLQRFRIGLDRREEDQGFYRVCFPVYDRQGRLRNVRRHLFAYLPKLTDERRKQLNKTLPWETGLPAGLFPLSALDGATEALIVEGEPDAALACQMGFAAVSGTGGAGTWHDLWNEELRGLARATILYDSDGAGQAGARKVAASVSAVVPDVRIARYGAAFPGRNKRGDF